MDFFKGKQDELPLDTFTGFGDVNKEKDFHEFRAGGLGSSDMAVILNVSPYKTAYELWQEKTGIKMPDPIPTYVMQRGIDLEPVVRDWFNNEYNCNCIPERKISDDYDFLRANNDGIDHDKKIIIEIKCGGKEDHLSGKVPDKYYPQVMFLKYIWPGYKMYYVSFNEDYRVIEVGENEDYTNDLIEKAKVFWQHVVDKKPIELSDKDDLIVNDDELNDLVDLHSDIKQRIDNDTKELKVIQKMISERTKHPRVLCNGHRLSWVTKKGNIDYKSVPFNGDIESYRKKSSKYFTIKRLSNASERNRENS